MVYSATIQEYLSIVRANISTNFEAASEACGVAITLAREEKDAVTETEALHLYAQVLFEHGEVIQAIKQIKLAIGLREALGDKIKISASLNSLCMYLTEIGDFAEALDNSFRALRIMEELDNKRNIASILFNIGSIYERLNNHQEEANMYERSLTIAIEINDKKLISYNHLNLGNLYTKHAKFQKANEYLGGLDELFISLGDKVNALKALTNSGCLFYKLGEYDRALEKHFACLKLSRETGNSSGIESSLVNIAETKIKMGKADEAKPFIDEVIELAEKNSQRVILKDAKLVLSEYYSSLGDHKNALEVFRSYIELKDELLNINNLKQLGELKLKYDIEKKEKEAEINQLKSVELKEAFDNLHKEKMRSDNLLLNILPEEVAEELKQTGTSRARHFEAATVMFIDIRNFTFISQRLSPDELVSEIDFLFRGFDEIIRQHNVEKIKTIGDAYMCAAGIPVADPDHAENMANAAFEILNFMEDHKRERQKENKIFFEIRIGINSGALVAGIVGSSKFAYDIWGDTVNTAARMEQSGEVGRINISGNTYLLLKDKYNFTHRGKIFAKNKGEIDMYFMESKK